MRSGDVRKKKKSGAKDVPGEPLFEVGNLYFNNVSLENNRGS